MAAIVAERTPLPDSTEPIPAPLVPDDVCRALDESQTRLGEGLSDTYRELCRLSILADPDDYSLGMCDADEKAKPQQSSQPIRLLALLAITDNFVEVCLHATDDTATGEALYEHYRTSIATIMTTLGISVAQVNKQAQKFLHKPKRRPTYMLTDTATND